MIVATGNATTLLGNDPRAIENIQVDVADSTANRLIFMDDNYTTFFTFDPNDTESVTDVVSRPMKIRSLMASGVWKEVPPKPLQASLEPFVEVITVNLATIQTIPVLVNFSGYFSTAVIEPVGTVTYGRVLLGTPTSVDEFLDSSTIPDMALFPTKITPNKYYAKDNPITINFRTTVAGSGTAQVILSGFKIN